MSPTRLHLEFGADVNRDLDGIEINEMTNAVMWDAPKLCPVPQRADGGFLVLRKNPAESQADDVRELALTGRGR